MKYIQCVELRPNDIFILLLFVFVTNPMHSYVKAFGYGYEKLKVVQPP